VARSSDEKPVFAVRSFLLTGKKPTIVSGRKSILHLRGIFNQISREHLKKDKSHSRSTSGVHKAGHSGVTRILELLVPLPLSSLVLFRSYWRGNER